MTSPLSLSTFLVQAIEANTNIATNSRQKTAAVTAHASVMRSICGYGTCKDVSAVSMHGAWCGEMISSINVYFCAHAADMFVGHAVVTNMHLQGSM